MPYLCRSKGVLNKCGRRCSGEVVKVRMLIAEAYLRDTYIPKISIKTKKCLIDNLKCFKAWVS